MPKKELEKIKTLLPSNVTNFEATTVVSMTTGGGRKPLGSARSGGPTAIVTPLNGAPNLGKMPAQ